MIVERISDFSGGMLDQKTRDKIAPNQSSFIENMEYRDGDIYTRRGSCLHREATTGETFQGSGVFYEAFNSAKQQVFMVAQGGKIYHYKYPFEPYSMSLPAAMLSTDEVRMIQALNYIYVFRGDGKEVWRWRGQETTAIEAVPTNAIVAKTMKGARTGRYIFNRLWLVTGDYDIVVGDILSEAVDYINNTLSISQGDGQRLIGVRKFGETSIVAYKERSIYFITGGTGAVTNASTDLTVDRLDSETEVGCVSEDTIVTIGVDQFFLSSEGVTSIGQNEQAKVQLAEIPFSRSIQKIFDRATASSLHKSSATHFDNYYLLAIPIDGHTEPNAIVAFDLETRSWAGLWRWRDSTGSLLDASNDPVYRHMRLMNYRFNGQDRVASIGYEGEFLRLLTSQYDRDFENSGKYYLGISNPDTVVLTDIATETSIESQTSGGIEFQIRMPVLPTVGTETFLWISSGAKSFTVSLSPTGLSISLGAGGAIQWACTADDIFVANQWHTFSLIHDGVEFSLFADTKKIDLTFSTTLDKTQWLAHLDTPWTLLHLFTSTTLSVDVKYLSFQEYDGTLSGSGRGALVAHFPLNEGTGTTITASNNTDITGSLTGSPTWSTPTTPAEIHSSLITKDFFSADPSDKKITEGELVFRHMNPKMTVKYRTPSGEEKPQIIDKTYDETKYDKYGHADYVVGNTNLDHDDNGRKNYTPTTIPQAGITMAQTGFVMGREVERSERIFGAFAAKRCAVQIDNTQGRIAIKEIIQSAVSNGLGNTRSLI